MYVVHIHLYGSLVYAFLSYYASGLLRCHDSVKLLVYSHEMISEFVGARFGGSGYLSGILVKWVLPHFVNWFGQWSRDGLG